MEAPYDAGLCSIEAESHGVPCQTFSLAVSMASSGNRNPFLGSTHKRWFFAWTKRTRFKLCNDSNVFCQNLPETSVEKNLFYFWDYQSHFFMGMCRGRQLAKKETHFLGVSQKIVRVVGSYGKLSDQHPQVLIFTITHSLRIVRGQ